MVREIWKYGNMLDGLIQADQGSGAEHPEHPTWCKILKKERDAEDGLGHLEN